MTVERAAWTMGDHAERVIGYAGEEMDVAPPKFVEMRDSDPSFSLSLSGLETDVQAAVQKMRDVWACDSTQPIRMPAAAALAMTQWLQVMVLAGQVEAVYERQARALGNGGEMTLERTAYEELVGCRINPRRLTLCLKDLGEMQARATRLLKDSPDHPKRKAETRAAALDATVS